MVDAVIREMIELNGTDTRRINHALKVYGWHAALRAVSG